MSSMIDLIEAVSESPFTSVIAILLFIAAIKGLYEFVKWIKTELNAWYLNKNTEDKKEENIDQRIEKLETENSLQFEKLQSLEDSMIIVNDTLANIQENMRLQTVVSLRAEILRIWHEVVAQGYITQAQYEVFQGLSEVYLENKGNGLFRNKIIPEIEKLEVRD